jgi:tail collar domain
MITYNLAPIPVWQFTHNSIPLVGGTMYTYLSTDKSTPKAVFSDPSGLFPYTNPIIFDGDGKAGPFYFASDALYYIEIYDQFGNIFLTIDNYPGTGSGTGPPINVTYDLSNHFKNGQFAVTGSTVNFASLQTTTIVAPGLWDFKKSNTSATDTIAIKAFPLGTTIPSASPVNYFEYACTGTGAGGETYKYLSQSYDDVRTFENQTLTFSLWAQGSISGPLEIIINFNYGTGGSPPFFDVIGPITISNTWTNYSLTFTMPTQSGKVIGTGFNGFDLGIQFPLNTIATFDLTNLYLSTGNVNAPYPIESTPEIIGYLPASYYPVPTASTFENKTFGVLGPSYGGMSGWQYNGVPVGTISYWLTLTNIPISWMLMNGQSLLVAQYPDLFALIGYTYGGSGPNFNIPFLNHGYFLRPLDVGGGIDPGRTINTLQGSQNLSHTHGIPWPTGFYFGNTGGILNATIGGVGSFEVLPQPNSEGGSEARPNNIAFPLIMKVTYAPFT